MATSLDTDNALLSLDDFNAYIGQSSASTADDDIKRDIINQASWRFNAETARNLKSRSYTTVFDGNGTNEYQLVNWPLSSTAMTITIDANRAFTDTDDVVTSTDVFLDTGQALIRLDSKTFSAGFANIQVEYSAGYTTALSFDLTLAAKEYGRMLWDRRSGKSEQIGIRSMTFPEGGSVSYENDMPWSVRQVLSMYRDRSIG